MSVIFCKRLRSGHLFKATVLIVNMNLVTPTIMLPPFTSFMRGSDSLSRLAVQTVVDWRVLHGEFLISIPDFFDLNRETFCCGEFILNETQLWRAASLLC